MKAGRVQKKRFSRNSVSLGLDVCATDILEKGHTLRRDSLSLITNEKDFTPEMYDLFSEPPKKIFDASKLSEILLFIKSVSLS